MARSARRDDEDALDPVEEADLPTDEEDDDLDGFSDVEADDAEADAPDLDADDLEFDEDAADEDDLPETEGEVDDDEDAPLPLLLPDDEIAAVVAETDDEDEDEEDALKDGEFVCRSCFMAKRESALADPEAMLCRDCV